LLSREVTKNEDAVMLGNCILWAELHYYYLASLASHSCTVTILFCNYWRSLSRTKIGNTNDSVCCNWDWKL